MTLATTVTPLATFRNETPYPFCPGCGHHTILDRLNEALVKLEIDPRRIVLVTDIGCSGLSDQYFDTSAFHGLHGRSLTYATGIKLARPDLEVVVIMGDGGTGIGGAHLLNAARRNAGITVLVFNNFNFGMTGGQHSPTTPQGAITATTPEGNLERPLDLCATVGVNGAAWAGRFTSFDADLADRIAEAIATPGFALLDIWELCTAYYVPSNQMSRRTLSEMLTNLDFPTGVLYRRDVAEYATAYRAAHVADRDKPRLAPEGIEPAFASPLDRRFHLVVAGSAGGKVRSAARLLAQAAILSGLYAAHRDDYPITVKTGHSIAELILSPKPIDDTGVEHADALLILSEDGRKKAGPYVANLAPDGRIFTVAGLGALSGGAAAEVLDFESSGVRFARTELALAALAAVVARLGLFPMGALEEAARRSGKAYVEKNLAAIAAGGTLASGPGGVHSRN